MKSLLLTLTTLFIFSGCSRITGYVIEGAVDDAINNVLPDFPGDREYGPPEFRVF